MSILRDGVRVFVDTHTKSHDDGAAFALPATARPATLVCLSGRSAQLIMDEGQPLPTSTNGVVYRKTRFGLFAAPVTFSGTNTLRYRAVEAVLLNHGAFLQRREYVRVSTALGISVFVLESGKARSNFTTVASNISQGGMRIQYNGIVKIGQQLKISFLVDGSVVGLNSIIKSTLFEDTLGIEFVDVPPYFAKIICLLVYKTQISQNPNLGQGLNKSMHGVELIQDLTDADYYWDIFSARTVDSVAVVTNYCDFNNIVFGSF